MPVLKVLGGLRRFAPPKTSVQGATVSELLLAGPLPTDVLFPGGELNRDIEVLVNGRNIAFLSGLATPLMPDDHVTVFLHGARGYPGG